MSRGAPVARKSRPSVSAPRSLLTIAAVAAQLGVCRATAYRLVDEGALPLLRISNSIRVAVEDLDAFVGRSRRS